MLNYQLYAQGVSPQPLWLPRCDNHRTGAASLSLSTGVVCADWQLSPHSSYQHPEFHIKEKGIFQSRKKQ